MADNPQDREKKRAAAFPWRMRSGAPTRLSTGGIDWSSPAAALKSFWNTILYSPHAGFMRVALGAAIAVNAALAGTWLLGGFQSRSAAGEPIAFASRSDDVRQKDSPSGRTSVESLFSGLRTVLSPGTAGLRDAPNYEEAEEEVAEAGSDLAAGEQENKKDDSKEGKEDGEPAADSKDSFRASGLGQLASSAGLGGSAASSAARLAAPMGAGRGGSGKLSGARRKTPARGSRSISRGRSGGKGVLGQLKFAKNQSRKGAFAAGQEGAFEAADAANQGVKPE